MTGKRPNILLVVSDQQGASMMRCAGTRHLRTSADGRQVSCHLAEELTLSGVFD